MFKTLQRIRVQWSHCDPAGIIFNPHYYVWMDQATHQLLQAAGFDLFEETGKDGFRGCPLVSSALDFKAPLYLGDIVTVTSHVETIGNSSFTVNHSFAQADKTIVASGHENRVWAVSHPDDPKRMTGSPVPDRLRRALERPGVVDTTV